MMGPLGVCGDCREFQRIRSQFNRVLSCCSSSGYRSRSSLPPSSSFSRISGGRSRSSASILRSRPLLVAFLLVVDPVFRELLQNRDKVEKSSETAVERREVTLLLAGLGQLGFPSRDRRNLSSFLFERVAAFSRDFHPLLAATRDHHQPNIPLEEPKTFFSPSFSSFRCAGFSIVSLFQSLCLCLSLSLSLPLCLSVSLSVSLFLSLSRSLACLLSSQECPISRRLLRFLGSQCHTLLGLLKTSLPEKRLLDSILATDPFRPPPSLSLLAFFLAAAPRRSLAARRFRPRGIHVQLHPRPGR
ncbi:hypothetical protein K0M31_000319 [Melipona bicolor]|uniref:Uncharacterized protein n=1 Tax=Melipona bicolor TaxID=60889 RepID=A0AA40KWQ1_9HYME|nr:hypothetical protein K0M31_000319 [Melipona bicolor]